MSPSLPSFPSARNVASWPLEKYSYAQPDSTALQSPPSDLQWTHLPYRDNLYLVIEIYPSSGNESLCQRKEGLRMRVVHGIQVLQELDLSNLVMKNVFSEGKLQPGALILGRSPCLAVKYTQNQENRCRRFQVRFRFTTDWDVATQKLQEYGLHVKPPPPPARNSESSQPSSSQLPPGIPQISNAPDLRPDVNVLQSYGTQQNRTATQSPHPQQHHPQPKAVPGPYQQPQVRQPIQQHRPENYSYSQAPHIHRMQYNFPQPDMGHPAMLAPTSRKPTHTMSPPPSSHGVFPAPQRLGTVDNDPIIDDGANMVPPPPRDPGLVFGRSHKPARHWAEMTPLLQPTFLPKPSAPRLENSTINLSIGPPTSVTPTNTSSVDPKPTVTPKKAVQNSVLPRPSLAKQKFDALAMGLPSPSPSPLKRRRMNDEGRPASSPLAGVHALREHPPDPPAPAAVVDSSLTHRDADDESIAEDTADEESPLNPIPAPMKKDQSRVLGPEHEPEPEPDSASELEPEAAVGSDSEEMDINEIMAEALADDSFIDLCEKIGKEWKDMGFSGWDGMANTALKDVAANKTLAPARKKAIGKNVPATGGADRRNRRKALVKSPAPPTVGKVREKQPIIATVTAEVAKAAPKKDKGKGNGRVNK